MSLWGGEMINLQHESIISWVCAVKFWCLLVYLNDAIKNSRTNQHG